MAIWPEYDELGSSSSVGDWWFNDPFFNRSYSQPLDVGRDGIQDLANQYDSRELSDAQVQNLINQGYVYQNGSWVPPADPGLLDAIEGIPNTGITEEFEQPTYVEDEELLDEVLSQGPREDETFDEYMNRVANIGWETRGGGGGIAAEDGPSSQQINSALGGMQGNPPELGEEKDEWIWNGSVLVNSSTGEERSVPNPERLITGGTYTGDAELIEGPDEDPVDDIPSSVLGDFIDPSLVINIPSNIPTMNGMGSSGGQIGSSTGSSGGSSATGSSNSGSSSSGSSSGSGDNSGLTTGQPPAESGTGTGTGSGNGSGTGAGSGTGTGTGAGGSAESANPQIPSPQTPIADSLFGSKSESNDLFPYTVINPSRAANIGGLLDYVAALNQRRIR